MCTSDFKSQSEGGAGGGGGWVGLGGIRSEESVWPEMCNTRSTTGIVGLRSFHQANFPEEVRVYHYQLGLKKSRKVGDIHS